MHFFYMDESGDTGANLTDKDQPIFVLGGISLRDEGWNKTHAEWEKRIISYFGGNVPTGFEMHSCDLLSPEGEGFFEGHAIERRLDLANQAIDLILERKHDVHLIAFNKARMAENECGSDLNFDPKIPYLLGFDYLITYINEVVKSNLGQSARGMIILDEKEEHMPKVEEVFYHRRFEDIKSHRVKWIVEFASAVDSVKNPMIQLSDLVILCARRFLEIEEGYKNPPEMVKKFYADCYYKIYGKLKKKSIVSRDGAPYKGLNDYLETVQSKHKAGWKKRYGVSS